MAENEPISISVGTERRGLGVGDEEVRRCKVVVAVSGKNFQASTPTTQTDLVLTAISISIGSDRNGEKEAKVILLEDLIGVHVEQKPPPNNPLACQVEFMYYPLVRAGLSRRKSRKRLSFQAQFSSANTFRDNLHTAKEWEKAINHQGHHTLAHTFATEGTSTEAKVSTASGEPPAAPLEYNREQEEGKTAPWTSGCSGMAGNEPLSPVPRDLLVLINPIGGRGKAESEFHKHVRPLFDQANIKYEIIVTERQGHAYDLMKDFDVSRIDGIVLASGDGLLYEVINGLMDRQDWEKAIKTPIGMLPLGSGNALCAVTLNESQEEFSLENAAFQIIRGGTAPLDIATVQTCDGQKHYMALLNCWGMVADVDIESEKWRKLGDTRFVLGCVNCIVRKRVYRGRLHYLPEDEDEEPTKIPDESGQQELEGSGKEEGAEKKRANAAVTFEVEGVNKPEETPEGDSHQCEKEPGGAGIDIPGQVLQPAEPLDTHIYPGSYSQAVEEPIEELANLAASTDEPLLGKDEEVREKPTAPTGPPTTLLPRTLSDPVPDTWKTIEADFLMFAAMLVSHMSKDFIGAPGKRMGTGTIRISYLPQEMSRLDLLRFLTSDDTKKWIESNNVPTLDIRAYRLEPITSPGMLTIDGEAVEYGPIQVEVHKHMGRVMCRKRNTTGSTTE